MYKKRKICGNKERGVKLNFWYDGWQLNMDSPYPFLY
jgi:hypothetical protein